MAKSTRHSRTALPHRYRDDALEFEVDGYRVDGGSHRSLDLGPSRRVVDLHEQLGQGEGDSTGWERATLTARLSLTEDLLSDVFPAKELESPPGRLSVSVRCHDTIYRDGVTVAGPPASAGEYRVEVPLDWGTVRGTVAIRPHLVRTEQGDHVGAYATAPNAKLASGPRYQVQVDSTATGDSPAIDGEEIRFSEHRHLPDADQLYFLDFRDEARPKLWINADNPRIADVLRSEGSVGAEPRMRDVILDQISYGVWTQLVVQTVTAIDESGELDHEWQETVFSAFATNLYDLDDPSHARERLRDEIQEPDGIARLIGRLDAELQAFIDPRTQLINLMEEGVQL